MLLFLVFFIFFKPILCFIKRLKKKLALFFHLVSTKHFWKIIYRFNFFFLREGELFLFVVDEGS
jgi:hypothetical protein